MIVGINTKFDAGHHLPNYKGKCNHPHGHTWHLEVELFGSVDEVSGMVIDFSAVKSILNLVLEELDHKYLNDFTPNPTCENLIRIIWKNIVNIIEADYPTLP